MDPIQIRRLYQNLISNALKFRKQEVSPVINIKGFPGGDGMWEILVQDNGIGFEEKFRDRIFKPFKRLNHRKSFEGTGMGLAICQKIVRRHSGEILVQSQPEMGTTFIIKLPEKQSTDKPLAIVRC